MVGQISNDTLRVSTFSKPLAVVTAVNRGLFGAAGLDVHYEQTSGSISQIARLLAGRVDVAHTAVDNVMAYVDRDDADLFVFLVLELGIGQKLILRPGLGDYTDLRGQTVGVDAPTTGYAFVLYELLGRNGLAPDEYETVTVGATHLRAGALIRGEIAATLLSPPHDQRALQAGCQMLDRAASYLPDYPAVSAATTSRTARSRRTALVRYTRALIEAEEWASNPDNRREAISMLAVERGLDDVEASKQYRTEARDRQQRIMEIEDATRGVEVVRDLRHRMTNGTGGTKNLDRYFDSNYMVAANSGRSTS